MKLTDTQLVLLLAASQRDDRALERPSNLVGGAAGKVVAKLLTEVDPPLPDPERECIQRLMLVALRSEPVAEAQELRLIDRRQDSRCVVVQRPMLRVPPHNRLVAGSKSCQLHHAVLRKSGSAAPRRDAPASTASITRSRKSSEYGWTPKRRISAVRLAPRNALRKPFDSTQPENALASC